MIPTPFVLNDAVIIRQKVKATPKSPDAKPAFRIKTQKDSLTVVVDSIR
jgi:hypothetical protein